MKNWRTALFGFTACLVLSSPALAQTVSGSTTIDIDAATGTVTATCETDLDSDAQGYYYALVDCSVRDSDGNTIASGVSEDQYGIQGYAQVVLTFAGVPGTTYTAIGTHGGVATLSDYAELPPPQQSGYEYDDEFNFGSFAEHPQTYIDDWNWTGPGPEVLTRQGTLKPGFTEATATYIKITYTGQSTALNNTTQSAVVGQQIALTAAYDLPTNLTVQSQSWPVPGTTVGGYTASVSSGATTAANFSQASTTFYWVDAGNSRNVTFNLKLSDGSTSSASVPFNVSGPTSPGMTATLNPGGVTIDSVGNNILLEFGNNSTTFGITFTPTVTQPSGVTGTFSYIQLINSEQENITDPPLTGTCTIGTGLDNNYPYPPRSDGTAADSPATSLNSTYIEVGETFSATMYLMWNSGLPNSIPVPLGSMQWGYSGDAYRSSTDVDWALRNPTDTSQAFVQGITYPTWSTHATNNNPQCKTN